MVIHCPLVVGCCSRCKRLHVHVLYGGSEWEQPNTPAASNLHQSSRQRAIDFTNIEQLRNIYAERSRYCFTSVRVSVCLSVCPSEQKMNNFLTEIDEIGVNMLYRELISFL